MHLILLCKAWDVTEAVAEIGNGKGLRPFFDSIPNVSCGSGRSHPSPDISVGPVQLFITNRDKYSATMCINRRRLADLARFEVAARMLLIAAGRDRRRSKLREILH